MVAVRYYAPAYPLICSVRYSRIKMANKQARARATAYAVARQLKQYREPATAQSIAAPHFSSLR